MRVRLVPVAALALAACAPSLGRAYQEDQAAAERAYSSGRYEEAAEHWLMAEKHATKRRNQTEARYRAAASYARAGRYKQAEELLDALVSERPKSARAARALFDRAELEIEHGDKQRGYALLESAMLRYPESGVAPAALQELIRWHEDQGGSSAALSFLDRAREKLSASALDELIGYSRAKQLEKAGRDEAAIAAYLNTADRHPYPGGALWDDALFNASLLHEKLGQPDRAVADLERMLKEREPSSLQGSYERPRFAPARYRIAELCRDRLHDLPRAAREFRRVWDEHPTSILRDDALWNEARIEREQGETQKACSTLDLLKNHAPESRYAPCVQALCPALAPGKGECHPYVVRDIKPTD